MLSCIFKLASSLGPFQILSHSCGENREKAWDQNYVTDRKWWTRLVRTESTLRTDRVHHFRSVTEFWSQAFSRFFSTAARLKIWEGSEDEAIFKPAQLAQRVQIIQDIVMEGRGGWVGVVEKHPQHNWLAADLESHVDDNAWLCAVNNAPVQAPCGRGANIMLA